MLRVPLKRIYSLKTATTAVVSDTVLVDQDTDGLVVKWIVPVLTGSGGRLSLFLQTTDDEGDTWYELGNLGNISSVNTTATARWAVIPIAPTTAQFRSSLASGAIATQTVSGLPLLTRHLRVHFQFSGTITTIDNNVVVFANHQSQYS